MKQLLFAVSALAFSLLCWTATPASAAADSWQHPCFPYDSAPNYDFGQYIGGWGYHVGEDVCHTAGQPVYAVADGTVVYSARTPDSYRWGNLILIEHRSSSGGMATSLYGHLSDSRQVTVGQSVSRGQLIGFVGPQGLQNGSWEPHLHFAMHPGGYGAAPGTYALWVKGYERSFPGGWVDPSAFVASGGPAFDANYGHFAGTPWMYANGNTQLTFKIWNTGTTTWQKDGPNPVRLGTTNPLDRASGFSGGGSNPGWVSTNRIKLDADAPPGTVATFTATFSSFGQSATYPECFWVLKEGVAWAPIGGPVCQPITVLPPGYRAEWVTQAVSNTSDPLTLGTNTTADYLLPGDRLNAKVLLKNVGELAWQAGGPNPVRIGTSNPRDRDSAFATTNNAGLPSSENWPSGSRPSGLDGKYNPSTNTISPATTIAPGEIGVFSFTVTAPDSPGTFNEYVRPLAEAHSWMPDQGIYFPLTVLDRGYHYAYAGQTNPPTIDSTTPSQQPVTVQIRNTGRQSWSVGGNVRLGTDRPRDVGSPFYLSQGTGNWLSPNRPATISRNVTNTNKSTIDPGEVAEFAFTINVPSVPAGTYQLYVQPVVDGQAWFPENLGIYFPITVTAKPYDYQVLRQNFSQNPQTVSRNSSLTATLAIKNTGRVAWPVGGPNAVRLGTARPNDRSSTLLVSGGTDSWLSASRASSIDGKVTDLNTLSTTTVSQINPGEIALFTVPLNTAQAGSYTEYFNLVSEAISWMPDYGIHFPLTVTP